MSMTLEDFLRETHANVRSQMREGELYEELIFADIVMQHMAEVGMTHEPVVCHYEGSVGNSNLRLTGYAKSDDDDQLDLFVSLYDGSDEPAAISDQETKHAAERCLRFLSLCAEGRLAQKLEASSDIRSLAETLQSIYDDLEQIRIFVLTDRIAKSRSFKTREIGRKSVRLEVMDIQRLFRHLSEGKPRDELVVDFGEVCGAPLPCIHIPSDSTPFDYALTAIPGEALRLLYEKYGSRLMEANVRSFLSVTSKGVNAGIQNTLRSKPDHFMAYNNGIVMVADEIRLGRTASGAEGILWLRGMQIVNGGQTTASLYFTRRKFPTTDLSRVRIPAKIIVLKPEAAAVEDALISDISRFANSQNAVKQSDLSANKPFHVALEKLSNTIYCPDGVGRWFYERAAGSYNTQLALEGTTQAKLRALKAAIPNTRRITKTDLARYLNAWDLKPDQVSRGLQKNFDAFMAGMTIGDGSETEFPGVGDYKEMVAKTIIFREAHKRIRPMFPAFQINVTTYTISVLAHKLGKRIDLDRIWNQQGLSPQLLDQIAEWARQVNDALHRTAAGKMISEWAKKAECFPAVLGTKYSDLADNIPEVRKAIR